MSLTRRHLLALLPISGVAAFGVGCARMLTHMQRGDYDPRAIATPLLNQPIPDFSTLPPLPTLPPSFDATALRQQERPVLLNVMASWCIPCVTELPSLKALSSHIAIWGMAYKDKPERVGAFLQRNEQPYQRIGQDQTGEVAINWGVSGVPESFLIFPGGRIVWHTSAPLTEDSINRDLLPLLDKAP